MKRFSLALAAVGLTASLSTYAALPTTAAPFQVVIPNIAPGWEFNLTGLYLDPDTNDQDYALVVNENVSNLGNSYNVKTENPGFDWAIGVGLGYVFPCTGVDVRAAWIHFFEHNNTDYVNEQLIGINVSPTFSAEFNPDFNEANGTQDFKYDAIDLDVGQFVDVGTRLQMRLFAGLRYAHIERDFDAHLDDVTAFSTTFLDIDNNSKFDGIGPLFGIDSAFHFGNCWGVVGHVDSTLLVGEVKTSDSFSVPTPSVGTAQFTSLNADDTNRVVPGFDGKLGLDWTYLFGDDCWFTAELGWQWTVYLDVFDRFQPEATSDSATAPFVIDTMSRVNSNFDFDGPYLSLNLKI